jgi:DNA-binding NarL/FixJ family response regulator
MRLRPLHARSRRASDEAFGDASARCLAVAVVGDDDRLIDRIRRVAGTVGTFEVVAADEPDRWGTPPPLPDETDAIVVADGAEARNLAVLRELHRTNPAWRLVVLASGTEWFEEAFELGADAWVDHEADDRTLELAITGEAFVREPRRRRTGN